MEFCGQHFPSHNSIEKNQQVSLNNKSFNIFWERTPLRVTDLLTPSLKKKQVIWYIFVNVLIFHEWHMNFHYLKYDFVDSLKSSFKNMLYPLEFAFLQKSAPNSKMCCVFGTVSFSSCIQFIKYCFTRKFLVKICRVVVYKKFNCCKWRRINAFRSSHVFEHYFHLTNSPRLPICVTVYGIVMNLSYV